MRRRILVVDIGGSFVKLLMSKRVEREFASGPRLTPKQFVAKFKETVRGWKFDVASIGFPAPVRKGRILRNPKHLGKDWVNFNFARALGIPGLATLGKKRWKREVSYAVGQLKRAFIADYVVLGGGLVHRFGPLPKGIVRGQNENAFLGGRRLWETKRNSRELKWHLL